MHSSLRCLIALALLLTILTTAHAEPLPRPDHVVVVVEENHGYSQIRALLKEDTYLYSLVKRGMWFTQSYGVTHPSQPNYLALFSGSTQGVTSNACPLSFSGDNLASALLAQGLSFASYAESLPAAGNLSCMAAAYQRKHNPLSNWQGTRLPAEMNLRFADFPKDFSRLPTVSFVIPNQSNDMHDGSFPAADAWLQNHIGPYVEWAFKHNSLLILTWDEDNGQENNRVVTLLVGPMVRVGNSAQRIDHYSVLRTVLDFYGLPPLGDSAEAQPIEDIWK